MARISIAETIRQAPTGRNGRLLTTDERQTLKAQLGDACPDWYLQALSEVPIMGTIYRYMQLGQPQQTVGWATFQIVLQEAMDAIPGNVAIHQGYVPVGFSPDGGGDPYFVKFVDGTTLADDPPLMQIFHDQVTEGDFISDSAFRVIAPTLSDFFCHVSVLA